MFLTSKNNNENNFKKQFALYVYDVLKIYF